MKERIKNFIKGKEVLIALFFSAVVIAGILAFAVFRETITSRVTRGSIIPTDVQKGSMVKFGNYNWLALEISDGKALLITENNLENRQYHEKYVDITWEECSLRQYLNTKFINKSFTNQEKALIVETLVSNPDNQWYGIKGGNDTKDRVFLLSLAEIVEYFGDSGQFYDRPEPNSWTVIDEYSPVRKSVGTGGSSGWWWLRSPGNSSRYAATIRDSGDIYVGGIAVDFTALSYRPALWMSLN